MDVAAFIEKNWATISSAPLPFVVAVAAAGGLVWYFASTFYAGHYSGQITTLQTQVTLAKEQRDDYKAKLGGASPDQAKSRMDALEMRLSLLEPRRLTSLQKEQIAKVLKTAPPSFALIESDMACGDCAIFAADFQEIVQMAGWQVMMPRVMGASDASPKGLVIVRNTSKPNDPSASALIAALTAQNVSHDLKDRPGTPFPGVPENAVRILITSRASS